MRADLQRDLKNRCGACGVLHGLRAGIRLRQSEVEVHLRGGGGVRSVAKGGQ